MTFWLGHAQKSKFWDSVLDEKVTYVFRLFEFWNFFFVFPFSPFLFFLSTVIDPLGLLASKKASLRRAIFTLEQSSVLWQEILVWVFRLTLWAFLCISQAPFGQSLWSGHHWKDLFFLQKLSICQFWSNAMTSEVEERPRLLTAGTGVNGLITF